MKSHLVIFYFVLSLNIFASLSIQKTTELPYQVQEIYPTFYQNELCVAGGLVKEFGKSFIPTTGNKIVCLNKYNSWYKLTELPAPRHHISLVSSGELLFAFGGYHGEFAKGFWHLNDNTWLYHPRISNDWIDLGPMPEFAAEMVSVEVNGKIHFLTGSGRNFNYQNNYRHQHLDTTRHLVFDPETRQWSKLPEPRIARNSAAGVYHQGKIYLIGGRYRSGTNEYNLDSVEIYDFTTGSWNDGPSLPEAIAGHAAAVIDEQIYVVGGERFVPFPVAFNQVWTLVNNQWEVVGLLEKAVHGHGFVSNGLKNYIIGGANYPGASGTSSEVLEIKISK